MKKNLKNRASAILVSFFLTAILIVFGLGIASIILNDLYSISTMTNGYKALYAAEGATELGLKLIKDKLPGYERNILGNQFSNKVEADLSINALEDILPCEEQDSEESGWRSLAFNESLQIPLFYQKEDSTITNIEQFTMEFYMPRDTTPSGEILRWKILGLNTSNQTEAISEYISIDGYKNSASNPTIFGSSLDSNLAGDYFYANYYRPINSQAYSFEEAYSISSFLQEHTYNYLIVTNIIQLSAQDPLNRSEEKNNIYIKYKPFVKEEAVCEFVKLNTSSSFEDAIQRIKTYVKEGENLPVFDFALYHTSNE